AVRDQERAVAEGADVDLERLDAGGQARPQRRERVRRAGVVEAAHVGLEAQWAVAEAEWLHGGMVDAATGVTRTPPERHSQRSERPSRATPRRQPEAALLVRGGRAAVEGGLDVLEAVRVAARDQLGRAGVEDAARPERA